MLFVYRLSLLMNLRICGIFVQVTNVTAANVTPYSVNLKWTFPSVTANFNGTMHFQILRNDYPIHFISATLLSIADIGLIPDTTYFYTIRAWNAYGAGAFSVPFAIRTPPALPVTPPHPQLLDTGSSYLKIIWLLPPDLEEAAEKQLIKVRLYTGYRLNACLHIYVSVMIYEIPFFKSLFLFNTSLYIQ